MLADPRIWLALGEVPDLGLRLKTGMVVEIGLALGKVVGRGLGR